MKRQLAFCIFILTLASLSLACRISITPTPIPTLSPTITTTPTETPNPTQTPTPTPTATPPLTAFNSPPLIKLQMFSAMQGVGLTENQVLVTNDGAIHWAQMPLPDVSFGPTISAYFIDMKICYFYVPGSDKQPGKLLASRDGGVTWDITETPFSKKTQIYFNNDNDGFAIETIDSIYDLMTVSIYQTLNRGKTWTRVFTHEDNPTDEILPVGGFKTGIPFMSPSMGVIGLSARVNSTGLYRSGDAGRTWTKQELTLPERFTNNFQTSVLPAVFFKENFSDGILPVDIFANNIVLPTRIFYITHDSALTWQAGAEIAESTAYDFLDPQTGWAWGKQGLYSTIDGAKTWQIVPAAFGRSERASIIDFVDTQNGWIVTIDSKNILRMYRSKDGGATWVAMANQ